MAGRRHPCSRPRPAAAPKPRHVPEQPAHPALGVVGREKRSPQQRRSTDSTSWSRSSDLVAWAKTRLAVQAAAEQSTATTVVDREPGGGRGARRRAPRDRSRDRCRRANKPDRTRGRVERSVPRRVVPRARQLRTRARGGRRRDRQLTNGAVTLHIVATNREPLGVEGESWCRSAARPRQRRARALRNARRGRRCADRAFATTAGPTHLRTARRPAARDRTGARTARFGPTRDRRRARRSLLVASGGRRRGVDRHQTMRATVEWSYQLLEPELQRLLEWMAMFPGGFELDAARHVAEHPRLEPYTRPRPRGSLVRKSMVEADIGAAVVRYQLLETVRAFRSRRSSERGRPRPRGRSGRVGRHPHGSRPTSRAALKCNRTPSAWNARPSTGARRSNGGRTTPAHSPAAVGPPTRNFLFGHHELREVLLPLLDLCTDGPGATPCSADGGRLRRHPGSDELTRWSHELAVLEATRRGRVDWSGAHLQWSDDTEAAVELCLRARGTNASLRTPAISSSASPPRTGSASPTRPRTQNPGGAAARGRRDAPTSACSARRPCWVRRGRWVSRTPIVRSR